MFSLLILLLSPGLAFGQSLIDFGSLPQCANGCTEFTDAQAVCVPPRALQSTMNTYFSCFCQSSLLATFKSTGSGICPSVCTATDLTSIQSWYNSFCAGPVPQEDTVVIVTATSATASATSSQATTSSTSGPGTSVVAPVIANRSWISTHYGWVIFIILLFILMVGGFIFGVWFRKRRGRKEETRLAAISAGNPSAVFSTHSRPMSTVEPQMPAVGTAGSRHSIISRSRTGTVSSFHSPVVWGPHQHQAHTNGYEYPLPPASPVNPPVPTPVYGPRFSRERLSSIHGDGELSAPRTPVSVSNFSHPRVGTPQSVHRPREHMESRFIEADHGDGTDSMHFPDSDVEGSGQTVNNNSSRRLNKGNPRF